MNTAFKHLRIFTFSLLFFSHCFLFAQSSSTLSTLGYEADILLQEELEKLSFQQYWKEGAVDPLGFLLALAPDRQEARKQEAQLTIDKLIQQLENKKLRKKPLAKQIKTIHGAVYDNLFRKYEADALFHQMFEDGTYQCVTGTALFSMILTHFDIKHSIIAHADHTNIMIQQGGTELLLESTEGEIGSYRIGPRFQKAYVSYLKNNRLISSREYQGKTEQEIFSSYFQQQESIQLKELIGIHYANQGLLLFEQGSIGSAIKAFEKASMFWTNEKVLDMLLSAQWQAWYEWEGEDVDGLILSGQFIQLFLKRNKAFEREQEIRTNFLLRCKGFWDQFYLKKIELEYAQKGYDGLIAIVQDSMLRTELAVIFHESIGAALSREKIAIPAITYYMKAFQIRPEDPNINANFIRLSQSAYYQLAVLERNEEELDRLHQILLTSFSDSTLQQFFSAQYHLSQAKYFLRQTQAFPALDHAQKAYIFNPDSAETQAVFAASMVARSWEDFPGSNNDWEQPIAYLQEQIETYPFVQEQALFLTNYGYILLNGAADFFRKEQFSKGQAILRRFESIRPKIEDQSKDMDEAIQQAYWEGASYWLRNQQFSRAKSFFQQGVKQMDRAELAEEKLRLLDQL